jgi:endonuclease/exonuclease/phosphatase family metal-dependent hydrolase
LKELKKYEYFICLGDINASDEEQLRFQKAGFNIANGGYLGWFTTSSGSVKMQRMKDDANCHIDNIITSKNIKIMNVSAPYTGLNDYDHLPVITDIIITE